MEFFFLSCCATLSPQTVSISCTGRGTGKEAGLGGREECVSECVCVSLENEPGPRPALPWASAVARILTTCVYSM